MPVADYCAYIPERRWWHLFSAAPRCREESEAFSVAVKSGADLTTLEAREYPLNKVAICIYLILVLGVLWISAWDELRFFYSQLGE